MPDRSPFLLDPDVVFLNHGSFGAVPGPVFAEYQRLQLEMERQPVAWLQRSADTLLAEARRRLAAYVGCSADDLVYVPNPTTAINMVAKSLVLEPGDEILTTDHEYGAMDRTWKVICAATGARYVQAHIPFALTADDFVERVWAQRSARTKVLFLSHMTSATAMRFPVEELVTRAREAGILTIIDGAHIPGHVPLDLTALGADIYTGANHKWLCAPKGSAFVHARPEVQHLLRPLVVSWGWESDHPSGSQFVDHHEWQGTRDLSPFLATPAAIDWVTAQDWPAVQARCHARLRSALGTDRRPDRAALRVRRGRVRLVRPTRRRPAARPRSRRAQATALRRVPRRDARPSLPRPGAAAHLDRHLQHRRRRRRAGGRARRAPAAAHRMTWR